MKVFFILTLLIINVVGLKAQPIAIGSVAPDFSLKNYDGTTVSLSDYANEKEIFREGSKKWLEPKNGTIAAVLINKINDFLAEKNN